MNVTQSPNPVHGSHPVGSKSSQVYNFLAGFRNSAGVVSDQLLNRFGGYRKITTYFMTKGELIEAMADFPDNMPVRIEQVDDCGHISDVTEICPTETDTSENYLLIS